ncbi:MAG: hypothetical protein K9N38_11615 [Candidatus Marinimicrobia bacterium]|nr:hypothetical protein [Candidatus Neomarinimicrobiota bacterium]
MNSKIWLLCVLMSVSTLAQEQSTYEKLWNAAMADSVITVEEQALLEIVSQKEEMDPPSKTIPEVGEVTPPALDQSGRWPLVLQNIAIGAGLYGWGIPYVLNAEDFRWYTGGVMISAGSAFYLTYQYTKNVEVTHARTQMMRYGELLGLRYGSGINKAFDLNNDDYEFDDNGDPSYEEKRAWAWVLMGAVPAGHYVGELLYERYEPSNGQAWVWSTWTAATGISARLAHSVIEEQPTFPEWDLNSNYLEQQRQYEEDMDAWEKRKAIIEMVAYPLGIYAGKQMVQDKNYSFGDAMMILQGWSFGYFNTMMLQSLLFDEGDDDMFFFLASAGGMAHMYGYDHWIRQEDYDFGESMLMLLGSGSGIFFGFGTAIMLDITDKPMLAFALAGYGAGTYLTKTILDVRPDGSLTENTRTKVSIAPTAIPTFSGNSYTVTPGIGLNISFR